MYEYEEVPLAELTYDAEFKRLQYPCPCGDLFEMALEDLLMGKDIAQCPTCSLTVKVLFTSDERDAFLKLHGIESSSSSDVSAPAIVA